MKNEKVEIYGFSDFREYMKEKLAKPPFGRGAQGQLAQFLNCQPSFVSQILSGRNELSLEYAQSINTFFSHSSIECEYFFTLVQLSKSGTVELTRYLRNRLDVLREQGTSIDTHSPSAEVNEKDIMTYYGDWSNIAIHMMVTISNYQSVSALSGRLGLPEEKVRAALTYLVSRGFVVEVEPGVYKPGESQIHLKKASPYAKFAATSLRLQTMRAMDLKNPDHINYSAHFTISSKSYDQIKKRLKDMVRDLNESVVEDSPEDLCVLTLDLMRY